MTTINAAAYAERCQGLAYSAVKKTLESAGFYQTSAKPSRQGEHGVATWWHGHNETRSKFIVVHTWVEVSMGMCVPGAVVSAEWISPRVGLV